MSEKPSLYPKGRFQLKYRGVECKNCSHPLDVSDRYCPSCSQANSTKKLTLKDFIDEFFSSLISYDSKLLKTFSALLLRPGSITKDYIAGKRISYTNPFRFLLSLGIVYFLMLNFTSDFEQWDEFGADKSGSWFKEDGSLSFSTELDDENKKDISKAVDSLKLSENLNKSDSVLLSNPQKHFKTFESDWFLKRFSGKLEFFSAVFRSDKTYEFEEILQKYTMENSRVNRMAFSAAKSVSRLQRRPGSFFSDLVSKMPFAIFFFLPLFALVIWLAYIRKKHNYTDHLIFSFHIQSLFFILLIISFVIDAIFDIYSSWFFILVFAIYLFLAMKRFYQQGYFKTLIKFLFLNSVFFILAMFTMILLLAGSAFTY